MDPHTTGTAVFRGLPDLASAALGGEALWASDEFFAGRERLLLPNEPEWREGVYTDRGKWMDGWEPRRRRAPGHDTCIIRLGVPGDLAGVDIDTRFFMGNHPPYGAMDATTAPDDASVEFLRDQAVWTPVLEQVNLERGGHNVFALRPFAGATHVRLHIYPAGGVARLRVHGQPRPVLGGGASGERLDLACVVNGGRALACSDMFFARMDNLILPGDAPTMGDGWETKRSPLPRQDWVVLGLGAAAELDQIVLDTKHFKGNFPEAARVDGLFWPGAQAHALTASTAWEEVVPPTRLGPDRAHHCAVTASGPFTHLRLTILSDGGVSRLRALGRVSNLVPGAGDALLRHLNALTESDAREALLRCCGSKRWVEGVLAHRPFLSRAHLFGVSEQVWWHLGDGDWLEAFSHHPRIGADVASLQEKFASTATWAEGEQSGVSEADEPTLLALVKGNIAYETRFGHLFIVCASGQTAGQMLAALKSRLDDAPEYELRVAAGEQMKITRLRLEKLGAVAALA